MKAWQIFLIALLAGGVSALLAGAIVRGLAPQYQSVAVIFISNDQIVVQKNLAPGVLDTSDKDIYLRAILTAPATVNSVIESLKLLENPQFCSEAKIFKDSQGKRTLARQYLSRVIDISSRKGLLTITATARSKELTAPLCNEYLSKFEKALKQRNVRYRDTLKKEIDTARGRLQALDVELRDFHNKTKLAVPVRQQAELEVRSLADVNEKLTLLKGELASMDRQINAPGQPEKLLDMKARKLGLAENVRVLEEYAESLQEQSDSRPKEESQEALLRRKIDREEKFLEQSLRFYWQSYLEDKLQDQPYTVLSRAEEPELPVNPNAGTKAAIAGLVAFFLVATALSLKRPAPPPMPASQP